MRRPAALYDIRRLLRAQLPYWSLSDLTLPPKVDPAAHGPAPRGPSPPIPPYPLIPAQKIPLSTSWGYAQTNGGQGEDQAATAVRIQNGHSPRPAQ